MNLSQADITPFQRKVYEAALKIPAGQVTTYRLLARAIDCGSNQAVGQALKGNPFAPEVPCHRVIRTDLTLGGFAGQTEGREIRRKQDLLRKEGVEIKAGKLSDPSRLFTF